MFYISHNPFTLRCSIISSSSISPCPKETTNPALAPYFAWKGGIECIRHKDVGDEMFGAELENEVADFFAKLTPLYTYFTRFGA